MVKKGVLGEIFSKAVYADDPRIYNVVYRDFEQHREMSLSEFIVESNGFETIPASRIRMIKRKSEIIFQRSEVTG